MNERALRAPASGTRTLGARIAATLGARLEDLRLAASALSSHRLRSRLTLLGIVIGVFTVVAMMLLLNGLQASIDKNMGGLGADVFQIQRLPSFRFGQMPPEMQRRKNLTLAHAEALREALPTAKQVGAEVWEGGKEVVAGASLAEGVEVAGGTPEFFTNNTLPIGAGRGYTEAEATGASRVVVLGAAVVDVLFPEGDPLGRRVRLGRLELEVIGTLERKGGKPPRRQPRQPDLDPDRALPRTGRSLNITVMARSHDEVARLQDAAIGGFRSIRGLDANVDNDFDTQTTRRDRPSTSSPAPSPRPAWSCARSRSSWAASA